LARHFTEWKAGFVGEQPRKAMFVVNKHVDEVSITLIFICKNLGESKLFSIVSCRGHKQKLEELFDRR
jgi:hypothetical protein